MRARKVDLTQGEIVAALRSAGCSVAILSSIGQGFPDLCIGIGGISILMEVKTAKKGFTDPEKFFRDRWKGSYLVGRSARSALVAVFQYMNAKRLGKWDKEAIRKLIAAIDTLDQEEEAMQWQQS
jgi:hypothetical protein